MGDHAALKIRALSVFSSKGARPAQEDHVLAFQDKGIFVVADGFGGPSPGAEASQMACEAVKSFLVKEAGDLDATLPFVLRSYFSLAGNVLFNALVHANRKITQLNTGKGVHERGGASVLASFLDGELLALANVGSCTAWLFREGKLTELVAPRTYGKLSDPFRVEPLPSERAPLMALGMADDLEPEIFEYRLRPGDWLLLQTDGLGADQRRELAEIQQKHLTPDQSADAFLQVLNRAQYEDNVSISLVIF
jgi:protein phosphatase